MKENLEFLAERPTNHIGGVYVVEPEYIVQDPDIPGEVTREADFTQDDSATDTTGLFDDDGTILTIEPPGDTSYVLGPMSSMWYGWGNFTQIGYIRESDRRMVNLGRIIGQLQNWDGETGFTSYGQLTLEQAKWFRDTPKYLNGYDNYRAFYPGPPSNTPDQYGRYLCTITGTPKSTTVTPDPRRVPPVTGRPEDVGFPWGNNPPSLRGSGLATVSQMPLDDLFALIGAALAGLGWALEALANLGISLNELMHVYMSRGGTNWGTDWGAAPGMDRVGDWNKNQDLGKTLTPQQQAEVEAAGNEHRDAQRALRDLPADATDIQRDMAKARLDKATKRRRALRTKHREENRNRKESSNLKGQVLSESRRRILRDIKKPYVLPEQKKVKYYFKLTRYRNANRTINSDLMKQAEVPTSFKRPDERLWGKYEKEKNARNSQDKKNVVLDHLGGGDHFLEYILETGREKGDSILYNNFGGKKPKKVVSREQLRGDVLLFIADETGKKTPILQSKINQDLDFEFSKDLFEMYFQEQETLQADKDPLFKKVSNKLKTEIDYENKPSKMGYPNTPPPKMVNGWHPEYGKDKGYYNKLDPVSAISMPKTGNPEIDRKVRASAKKKK